MPLLKCLSYTVAALAVCLAACQKSPEGVDATRLLSQAFDTAQPEVKQNIRATVTGLQSKDYLEALRSLTIAVANSSTLTEEQKHAAGVALQQVNQAVGANPALDSKEMHEQRTKLTAALVRLDEHKPAP